MAQIIKIIIKGSSGYCPVEYAYKDKLIIEENRICYECIPVADSDCIERVKWTRENNSKEYSELFYEVANRMPAVLFPESESFYTDVGEIVFIVTYADKTKKKRAYLVPADEFYELFSLIKKMIPEGETIPEVLRTSDNYDEYEEIYAIWNSETDYLITNERCKLSADETAESGAFFHWAYSINTAKGLFRRSEEKTVSVEDVHKIPNGSELVFKYSKSLPINLMLDDGETCKCIMENIAVWGTKYSDDFMVFSSNNTQKTYLIDSRGIIYELPCASTSDKYGNGRTVELDRRQGCYEINGVKVFFRSPEQRAAFNEKSQANKEATFNKDFNRFTKANAHNENGYLYLTAGNSKCGAIVSFFVQRGMELEVVPNIFCDDDTVNVRIPLTGENAKREDVQYLVAKYSNTYSIYNIPFTQIGGGLVFPDKWKQKYYDLGFSLPKGKETMIYSVVDTLRLVFGTDDDYEVFKKSLSKIVTLFERGNSRSDKNVFLDVQLLHPQDIQVNDGYVLNRLDYINGLLKDTQHLREKEKTDRADFLSSLQQDGFDTHGIAEAYERINQECSSNQIPIEVVSKKYDDYILGRGCHFSHALYECAYKESKRRYKAKMEAYESYVLAQISAAGGKISKWVNESNLFAAVVKEYPDAIYQYHAGWLGLQSIDVFIPSLKIGIEYQGEQHYRPIEIFGGEEGYSNTVKRDARKAALCKDNGIKLIYWKYDEVISRTRILKKINEDSICRELES